MTTDTDEQVRRRPGRPRTNLDTLPVQVYMQREQVVRVNAYATARGISQSQAIRELVDTGLNQAK